jgi:hypothetical protein
MPRRLIFQPSDPSGGLLGLPDCISALSAQCRIGAPKLLYSGAQLILADLCRSQRGPCSAWMFSPELASGDVRAVLTDWSLPLLRCLTLGRLSYGPHADGQGPRIRRLCRGGLEHEHFRVE